MVEKKKEKKIFFGWKNTALFIQTNKKSCSKNKEDIGNNQKITFSFKILSFSNRKDYSLKAAIDLLDTNLMRK